MTLCHETVKIQEDEAVHRPVILKNDHDQEDEAESIQQLRQALCNEKNLKSRLDDKFLLKFLRARKFDHDRALSLVKNYYKQRIKYPDFYKNMRVSSYHQEFAEKGLGKLSAEDPEGRTVFYARNLAEWDPIKIPILEIISGSLLALELAIEEEQAQENGFVFLIDAAHFGFRHLRVFDPFTIAQIISVTWNSFPAKFKRLHIINTPVCFKLLFSMLKPFLTKKLKSRFEFHASDLSNLYKELPREILPEEFGGLLGPLDSDEWNDKIHNYHTVIERDSIYGYIVD